MTIELLTAVGTTSQKLLLVVHLMAVVMAIGPTLLYGILGRESRKYPGEVGAAFAGISPALNKRVSLPALLVAAVSGTAMVVDSDDYWSFSQSWVSSAFAVVLALLLVGWFVLGPALSRLQNAIAKGTEGESEVRAAKASIGAATGLFHLGFVALLVLMVWKPGL